MTQEDKDLLLRDLCARLPYKVKVQDTYYKSLEPAAIWLLDLNAQSVRLFADEGYQSIEYIKPYLFPLSSMTEEQRLEYYGTFSLSGDISGSIDFYNKYHLDWRDLIPMGLAIDATSKNIY